MARRTFLTVPEELLEIADAAAEHFSNHGYTLGLEKSELGFPYTPTMLCKRPNTTVIVEVDSAIRMDRLRSWVAYSKSTGQDTRVVVALPAGAATATRDEDALRELGIGMLAVTDRGCVERVAPRDLALGVELPELGQLPRKVRAVLGPAYEQFSRSQWREGFEEACQAFETAARRYLKSGIRGGRIVVATKKSILTPADVDRLTMGQLGDMFARIQNQNYADAAIGKTLKAVNKDRVGVAHHKAKRRTENRLRANVGRHMWSLVAAMKLVM